MRKLSARRPLEEEVGSNGICNCPGDPSPPESGFPDLRQLKRAFARAARTAVQVRFVHAHSGTAPVHTRGVCVCVCVCVPLDVSSAVCGPWHSYTVNAYTQCTHATHGKILPCSGCFNLPHEESAKEGREEGRRGREGGREREREGEREEGRMERGK